MIAAQSVARATPDGHTLLVSAAGEVAVNQHIYKERMTYDPLKELTPVALAGIVPGVVVVAGAPGTGFGSTTPFRTALMAPPRSATRIVSSDTNAMLHGFWKPRA